MMLLCPFCQTDITLSTLQNGDVCGRCDARFVTAANDQRAKSLIARQLQSDPDNITVLPAGGQVYFGWDIAELLSASQISIILGKSKPLVQQYLREGRFENACQHRTSGGMPYWEAPRLSVLKFKQSGRKVYTRHS
jgi:hypothetical protein